MELRPNHALDDAFGLPAVPGWREPVPSITLPPERRPRNPAESRPVPVPTGFAVVNGILARQTAKIDARDTQPAKTAPEPLRREITRQTTDSAVPVVVATVPPEATPLERQGHDLLYTGGQWWHRCCHCGPTELLLVPVPGRNPRLESRPVFITPLGKPLRHLPCCPYNGEF